MSSFTAGTVGTWVEMRDAGEWLQKILPPVIASPDPLRFRGICSSGARHARGATGPESDNSVTPGVPNTPSR